MARIHPEPMPSPNPRPILAELTAPAAYAAELAGLVRRHAATARRPWEQEGLALTEVRPRAQASIAKELARLVSRGEYRFSPSVARVSHVGGKERVLYRASITDTAVVAVVAKALRRLCEPLLSERVYSYRSGRSSLEAVRDLAAFVRQHRAAVANPRARGLFLMRRDVTRYGESIPVHDGSRLWSMLQEVFDFWGMAPGEPIVSLSRDAVRPWIVDESGTHRLDRGVPTGSAIQPVINNLYLGELDRALGALSGGFYARFGDDVLFAHASAETFAAAQSQADAIVTALELTFKAEKSRDLFFNAAGRSAQDCRGTAFVEYLGLRLDFSGAIGLPTPKARRLLRELTRRLENEARLVGDTAQRRELLCRAAARTLDVRSPLTQVMVPIVAHAVDDRGQLRHLDYLVALRVAQHLSKRRGARAFRDASYRSLREAGLPSLFAARNRG